MAEMQMDGKHAVVSLIRRWQNQNGPLKNPKP